MKYQTVNSKWPEGTNDGYDLKPTPQEAIAAARHLYRLAMGYRFKGRIKLTSGRRYTDVRCGTLYVNPNYRNGGWHELVHLLSHHCAWRLYREGHGPRHAFIEREMINKVVTSGWLDGKLQRKPREVKPKPERKTVERERTAAALKRWTTKRKRAETAIRKLTVKMRRQERAAMMSAQPSA